jgi:hypothetical protein
LPEAIEEDLTGDEARVVPCLSFGRVIGVMAAAEFPQAETSNGPIHAKLYLPYPEQGYDRATSKNWISLK